jgi:hypothetical protein
MQIPPVSSELWTHIELAASILTPIGAGLWAFFNKLAEHSKSDAASFSKIEVAMAEQKGDFKENFAGVNTKLDTMWESWKSDNINIQIRRGPDT